MYIHYAKTKTRNKTHTSILLAHKYREDGKVKTKYLLNLSKWSKQQIFALKQSLKGHVGFSLNDVNTEQGKKIGAIYTLHKLAKNLGIIKALGRDKKQVKIILLLILARIITQGSRLKILDWMQSQEIQHILDINKVTKDQLYKSLEYLADNQAKIENRLFAQRYDINRNDNDKNENDRNGSKNSTARPSLLLYDITSSYLEGQCNQLAEYGYNRDKKRGKKQIVIGLITDDQGFPITVEVFKGNTNDLSTLESQVKKVSHRFNLEKITFVGDRGMIKNTQIKTIQELGFNYITAISRSQINKLIKQGVFQLELFADNICEIEDNDTRYIIRRNKMRVEELEQNRKEKLNVLKKLIQQQNEYLTTHPRASIEVAKRKCQTRLEKLKLNKFVSVQEISQKTNQTTNQNLPQGEKKTDSPIDQKVDNTTNQTTDSTTNKLTTKLAIKIDKEKLAEIKSLDGCYCIISDVKNTQMTKKQLHQRYKDLRYVEDAFKTFKTGQLEIRPIYLTKEKRTRGHVFVCMLSYMILHQLYEQTKSKKIKLTRQSIINRLDSITTVKLKLGDKTIKQIPQVDKDTQQILQALDIKLPHYIQ